MAKFETIQGSIDARLAHNLREKEHYFNPDIDPTKSSENYSLTPESHGKNSAECSQYLSGLLEKVYHRKGKTSVAGEWIVTAPQDLDPSQYDLFFESCYRFLNKFLCGNSDENVISATVHKDEIGQPHLHYIFHYGKKDNPKYISLKQKFNKGFEAVEAAYSLPISTEQKKELLETEIRFERDGDDKKAIADIQKTLQLKRDDARWVHTRLRRLESERSRETMISKEKCVTKKALEKFHPELQKWLDKEGISCTVYGGGGSLIDLSVQQLKAFTAATGVKLDKQFTVEKLVDLVNENRELIQENKHLKEVIYALEKEKTRETRRSGWGNRGDIEWTR